MLAGIAALTALVACGDPYLHTNPYDPAYPAEFTITGPDTLFSLGEIGQYGVQATPAWPDTALVWQTDTLTNYFINPMPCLTQVVEGSTVLRSIGNGAYVSITPPAEPYVFRIAIAVSVGTIDTMASPAGSCGGPTQARSWRHTTYKTVIVTQRIARIHVSCACSPLNVGNTASLAVAQFDALGQPPVPAQRPPFTNFTLDSAPHPPGSLVPVVTFLVRDSTIARITGPSLSQITALKSGTTWAVASRGPLHDSLEVVVP